MIAATVLVSCSAAPTSLHSAWGKMMPGLIKRGRDTPCPPHLLFDVPIFEKGELIGVKRRSSWPLIALRPNSEFRVLVVNDMRDIADFSSTFLKSWGFQVSTAYDGFTGLDAAKNFNPDLILLNYLMPGLSGLQVLQLLRRNPATTHIKVIIDSGLPIGEEAARLGAQDFIQLPYAFGELLGKVGRVLRS